MNTVLHWGGLAEWLQYYIGVGQKMVTLLHRGGLANDSGIQLILGYYIRNIPSIAFGKKSFLGGRGMVVNMITFLHRGVRPNDYSIHLGTGIYINRWPIDTVRDMSKIFLDSDS